MASEGSGKNTISVLNFLLLVLKPYRTRIFLSICAIFVSSISLLGIGNSLRLIINSHQVLTDSSMNISSLKESFSSLSLLVFLLLIASYGRIYLLSSASEYIIHDIRRKLFSGVFQPKEMAELSASEINVYLGEESIQLQGIFTLNLPTALTCLLVVFGGTALLIHTSPFLTFLLFTFFLCAAFVLYLFSKKFKVAASMSQEALNQMRSFIESIFVQFGLMGKPEDSFLEIEPLFEKHNCLLLERNVTYINMRAWSTAFVTALLFLGLGIVVLCGVNEIAQGLLTSGDLMAFIFYAITVSASAAQFSEMVGPLQRGIAILERFIKTISQASLEEKP